jgi:hypothetical protein
MPRNLTDLMEAAVSTAPPEPHQAADITRLAERRQRRRTTFVAGAAALAVVAVAGGAFGLTRGQGTTPEPAAPFKYGEVLDLKDAVAATSVKGFRVLPWTQPSVQDLGGGSISLPTYTGIDASGRLIVETYQGTDIVELGTVSLYDAPGQPASPLRPPDPPAPNSAVRWIPSFTGDGRLLWNATITRAGVPPRGGQRTVHITDLRGGQDVPVQVADAVNGGPSTWVTGDHAWYEAQQKVTSQGTQIRTLFTESISTGAPARLVARDVLAADVSDGTALWVTTDGQVHVANGDGSGVRAVPVPLDPGCTLTPAPLMSANQAIAVSRGVVALTEACGTGADGFYELLAFDTSGRPLVHVKGFTVTAVSLSGSSLALGGQVDQSLENLVYDLRTGTLASLGRFTGRDYPGSPQVAGRYVLWYDGSGGHVAEFTG